MYFIESDLNDSSRLDSLITLKLKRKDLVQQVIEQQTTRSDSISEEGERTMAMKTTKETDSVRSNTNTNTMGATVTYTNMLFYTFFFFMLMNPVLVLTQNIDTRAADVGKKETTPTTTLKPQPNTQNVQLSNQKNDHNTISNAENSGHVNCSLPEYINSSLCKDDDHGMVRYFLEKMSSNSGMLFRTMYVLLAVTGIVIIYFVIKAIRLRRRRSKSRKYGIITKQGDHGDMEMEPLGDGADEDDDYTVFEMSRRK